MADSKGVLDLNALEEILKDQPAPRPSFLRAMLRCPCAKSYCFPSDTHSYIMHLMEKFELCYPVGKEKVLIPQLLPVPEPKIDFSKDSALQFALHYPDFLPPSVFPRFMVKVHKDIHANTCWRTGVLLKDQRNGARALVKADLEARRINLWVRGERPREYLHYLRYLLADINSSFEKLTVNEQVPMPDDPHVSADYENLLDLAKAGVDIFIPIGSKKQYSVRELLGLVQPKDKDELVRLADKAAPEPAEQVSWPEMINDLFELKPNFFGVGLNLHKVFALIRDRVKQQRRQGR